ncbi:mitochondrial import receptor subunit TOM22 homolog [Portunus trituberculatus]|uniref:mitochondrial import receptor subunit TOM22 homolog n=1 Tax=Portunus trituberculatus TaxID=210409 RepID=UPI001E1CD68C|nr:mitochondrial import receptor subunit TOM22 homolog [Portunus trituberculatus]
MATLIELPGGDSGVASSEVTPESQDEARVSSADLTLPQIPSADSADLDEDEDLDESLLERVWGLTEMFPDRLRSTCSSTMSSSLSLLKSTYELSRQVVWVAVSSSVILFAPIMFEMERLNVEEMMKQDRNRLVFGPGSAVSGPPSTPGLMPPPPPAR